MIDPKILRQMGGERCSDAPRGTSWLTPSSSAFSDAGMRNLENMMRQMGGGAGGFAGVGAGAGASGGVGAGAGEGDRKAHKSE